MVSKFVKVEGKNCKIKVIGLYSANYYCISWISFIKNGFFLGFWKSIFPLKNWYFPTPGFRKTVIYIKNKTSRFFKKLKFKVSQVRNLVVCRNFSWSKFTHSLTNLKCIISMFLRKVTMYCIIYQLKFVNILTVIYISLFECKLIFLDTILLKKYFKEKSVPDKL